MNSGIKENKDKLFYELDWSFVKAMAERMSQNKGDDKYPRFNWKKKIDVEELNQALIRHFISVQEGTFDDGGQENGHLIALACNAMMLVYQLKHYKDEKLV
jgi:hypothetical protein